MRKHYIDNLRWLAVMLLIPYHAAQAWNVWGEPNYIIFGGSRMISSITVFFSPYYMPLLFILAGVSTRYALKKRTYKEYIAERAKRLLVPLLFGTLAIMPVMTYIADRYNCSYSGGFLSHYAVFFTKFTDLTGADGGFSFGQFWFLLYLFVISLIAAGIIALQKRYVRGTRKDIPFPLVCLLGLPLPILHDILSVGGKSLAEYTYIFLIGYYLFSDDRITEKTEKYRSFTLLAGLASAVLNVYLFIWSAAERPVLNTALNFAAEWFMLLALLGLGKRYLDFGGRISGYMSKRSFPFFSLHFIWVVIFQYLASGAFSGNTLLLYLLPILPAYVLTFISCEICLRVPPLSFLTGTKPLSGR